MNDQLMNDFAAIVTDLQRMTRDNSDPMRYSKGVAKEVALTILADAVKQAARLLEVPRLIDDDAKELAREQP